VGRGWKGRTGFGLFGGCYFRLGHALGYMVSSSGSDAHLRDHNSGIRLN
jgi:hypothetical protein